MALIDFAHIGLPKSASTFLQGVLFRNHPDIVCIGGGKVKHSMEGRPIEDLWLREYGDYDVLEARRGFESLIGKYETEGKVLGFSEECWSGHGISGHNALLAPERIREVFGEIKILLVLRHPVTYIYSQYNQFVKQGGAVTLRSLLDDETFWLKRNIVGKFNYCKLVTRIHELFGEENTLILPFEYLRDDGAGFCKRIVDFLSLPSVEFSLAAQNPSVSAPTLSILRFLNFLDCPRGVKSKVRLSAMLDHYLFGRIRGRRPSFEELLAMQPLLAEVFHEGNHKFWSGDLARYNYSFSS